MIYLGFDVGLRRIGVAVGQKITGTATPLPVLPAESGEPAWGSVAQLIATWRPAACVVGMPIGVERARRAVIPAVTRFVQELQRRTALPVHVIDERLTTKEARARVYASGGYKALERAEIDSLAAVLILEDWMETATSPR